MFDEQPLLLLLGSYPLLCLGFAFGNLRLVLIVIEIDDRQSKLQHIVHTSLPIAGPHQRIGVAAVRRSIVVDADSMEYCAGWKQRRNVIVVDVCDMPVEIEMVGRADNSNRI